MTRTDARMAVELNSAGPAVDSQAKITGPGASAGAGVARQAVESNGEPIGNGAAAGTVSGSLRFICEYYPIAGTVRALGGIATAGSAVGVK